MSGNHILSPLDVERLQSQGLLGRRSEKGTRRLHKRRLNRSSDEENKDIPLNVHVETPASANAFATIPDQLISRATLEYVGFSEAKALDLWNQWTNWPFEGPARETDLDASGLRMRFEIFFTGAFHAVPDTCSSDDQQWRQTMDSFGLSRSVQQAILDPNFKQLRLTQSCAYWAKDTALMRYAGLKDIQLESMARGDAVMQATGTDMPSEH
ncbi:unnamed protein product [Clonostachys solani]|uniref:Uncharacterized protein n=1 Tax=Clonostachys solani TaxID=160281 RepID=A0A9N9YYK0_9HYPO|nr:unnamed protein product [Clonostachys solani]